MAKLEYRLLDEAAGYPILYDYPSIDTGEVAARFACDKFIKDGAVFEKTSTAIEPLTYVIYVSQAGHAEGQAASAPAAGHGARFEIRQDWEGDSPGLLIEAREFTDAIDLVLYLNADYFYWLGDEWLRSGTVLDEDRKAYVYYAKKSS